MCFVFIKLIQINDLAMQDIAGCLDFCNNVVL